MKNKIQTCPYCGSPKLTVLRQNEATHAIGCDDCGASGPQTPVSQPPVIRSHGAEMDLLRTVIDESPDIILLKNWNGEFLLCNRALARLYGSTPEEMIGKSDADFNPNTEQVEFYLENVQAIMRSGDTQIVYENSTDVATGETRYFQSIKKPLKDPAGGDRILVIAHDITELKQSYQVIAEKEKRYAYAMDAANEGIWDWDIRQNRVTHNSRWCQLLGLNDRMSEHDMQVLQNYIHPEDLDSMMAALDEALKGDGIYHHEHRMLNGSGKVLWVFDRGRVMEYDDDGMPIRMVGSVTDITTRKEFEQRLEHTSRVLEKTNERLEMLVAERTAALERANRELKAMASCDPLTGVGNRVMLEGWLAAQPSHARLSVLMLDVDHFKAVNDRFGHKVGDQVLVDVAQCLRRHIRRDDIMVRWGGEEFLLVLNGLEHDQAFVVAEALRQQVEKLRILPSGEVLTISIGLSDCRVEHFADAMVQADEAMYRAKRSGRNRTIAYDRQPVLSEHGDVETSRP